MNQYFSNVRSKIRFNICIKINTIHQNYNTSNYLYQYTFLSVSKSEKTENF